MQGMPTAHPGGSQDTLALQDAHRPADPQQLCCVTGLQIANGKMQDAERRSPAAVSSSPGTRCAAAMSATAAVPTRERTVPLESTEAAPRNTCEAARGKGRRWAPQQAWHIKHPACPAS